MKCDEIHANVSSRRIRGGLTYQCVWPTPPSASAAPRSRPTSQTRDIASSTASTPATISDFLTVLASTSIVPGSPSGFEQVQQVQPGSYTNGTHLHDGRYGIEGGHIANHAQVDTVDNSTHGWNQTSFDTALSVFNPTGQPTTWHEQSIGQPGPSSRGNALAPYNVPDMPPTSTMSVASVPLWNTHHVSRHPQHLAALPQASISEFTLNEAALPSHRRPDMQYHPPPPVARAPIYIPRPNPNPPVPSDAIENVLPSADSKRLFHHVRSRTSSIMVAYGTNDGVAKNPYMALVLDLMLKNVSTYAQTAFRHSLLSLAAAHAHHESLQASAEQKQQMLVRTAKSRRKALSNLAIGALRDRGDQVDLALVTCLTIHIRDVCFCVGLADA